MSDPRITGADGMDRARVVLADDGVVALPADDGYHLAVRAGRPDALAVLGALEPLDAGGRRPVLMVGAIAQAAECTGRWSPEAAQLTRRCWPGPVTAIVPGKDGEGFSAVTMPAHRPLRALCRSSGPLLVTPLCAGPLRTADEVAARFGAAELALVVGGRSLLGPEPTVVDCCRTPPAVVWAGAVPPEFIEATLLMAARRRPFRRTAGR